MTNNLSGTYELPKKNDSAVRLLDALTVSIGPAMEAIETLSLKHTQGTPAETCTSPVPRVHGGLLQGSNRAPAPHSARAATSENIVLATDVLMQ